MLLATALGAGCGDSASTADNNAGAGASPAQVARENSQTAADSLSESDKGVGESGDRVWKQEARAFFDFDKYPDNRTFELDPDWARKFIETAYGAGAPQVWVTSISEFAFGGEKINIADTMVVVLPHEREKRQLIFGAYNAPFEAAGEQPLADIGQDYIFIAGD